MGKCAYVDVKLLVSTTLPHGRQRSLDSVSLAACYSGWATKNALAWSFAYLGAKPFPGISEGRTKMTAGSK